jgi:hypothetical protein
MQSKFILIVTTDGRRSQEFVRLLRSIPCGEKIALFILLQNSAMLAEEVKELLPIDTVMLYEAGIVPLSVARNRLLSAVEQYEKKYTINENSIVLLADDDCWYPIEFFDHVPAFVDVAVCRALDPESGKHFSTFNIEKRKAGSALAPWELMFYGVSISFLFRYGAIKGMRFKENIGLGNSISQGEESLFVMRLLERKRNLVISSCPEVAVYHPWKFASSSNNHSSLGYFLGWAIRRGFPFVLPFFLFLWVKYFAAMLIKPKKLYWTIFFSMGRSFIKGMVDSEKIGMPNA